MRTPHLALVATIAAALVVLAVPAMAGETLVELNFQDKTAITAANVTSNPDKPNERATGTILRPLFDNSGWAEVWTEYTVMAEDGKMPFQRIKVVKIEKGGNQSACGQIVCFLPDQVGAGRYLLTLKARAPEAATLVLNLRQRGQPYTSLWSQKLDLTPEGLEQSFEIAVEVAETTPVALYLQMPSPGTVDIASLKLERK